MYQVRISLTRCQIGYGGVYSIQKTTARTRLNIRYAMATHTFNYIVEKHLHVPGADITDALSDRIRRRLQHSKNYCTNSIKHTVRYGNSHLQLHSGEASACTRCGYH